MVDVMNDLQNSKSILIPKVHEIFQQEKNAMQLVYYETAVDPITHTLKESDKVGNMGTFFC